MTYGEKINSMIFYDKNYEFTKVFHMRLWGLFLELLPFFVRGGGPSWPPPGKIGLMCSSKFTYVMAI